MRHPVPMAWLLAALLGVASSGCRTPEEGAPEGQEPSGEAPPVAEAPVLDPNVPTSSTRPVVGGAAELLLANVSMERYRTAGGEGLGFSVDMANGRDAPVTVTARRLRVACLADGDVWVDLAGEGGIPRPRVLEPRQQRRISARAFREGFDGQPTSCDLSWAIDVGGTEPIRGRFCWTPTGVTAGECVRPEAALARRAPVVGPSVYVIPGQRGGHAVRARLGLRPGTGADLLSTGVAFACEAGGVLRRHVTRVLPWSALVQADGTPQQHLEAFAAAGLGGLAASDVVSVAAGAFELRSLPESPTRCDVTLFQAPEGEGPAAEPVRTACLRWEAATPQQAQVVPCPELSPPGALGPDALQIADVEHAVRPARGGQGHFVVVRYRATPTRRLPRDLDITGVLRCGTQEDRFPARRTDGLWAPGEWEESRMTFFPPHREPLQAPPTTCRLTFEASEGEGPPVTLSAHVLTGPGGFPDED